MDKMNFSISVFFEIKDSEVYGGIGSVGYAAIKLNYTVTENNPGVFDCSMYDYLQTVAKDTAKRFGVNEECVRTISSDEYEENVEA